MTQYRITKYNPKFRDEEGSYFNQSEWTAISDIGKPDYNNLSYEEYEETETAYVKAVLSILHEKKVNSLMINSLEVENFDVYFKKVGNSCRFNNLNLNIETDIKSLKDGLEIGMDKLDKLLRLILREIIYAVLIGKNIKVRFGYDYYMYVDCAKLDSSTIRSIEQTGLFVERDQGPKQFTIHNSN